ncbi:MAG TPA: type VI secretion system baseplate subunit TssE [Vicinamibacterales bacterium]|nr:type VI secretion system baseplate subunit TssE [Vicinamibacterales bacterium]
MPEQLPPQDQLQPALLDRLTDEEPDKKLEPRLHRVISKRRLREAVLRDLAWLFNTTRLDPGMDVASLPHARRSVINYGLPALAGQTASTIEVPDLERAIRQAIIDFEPRILPESLHVRALETAGLDHHNVIGVEISGHLWAQPLPLELLVRTEIDLVTGQVEVSDLAPRG